MAGMWLRSEGRVGVGGWAAAGGECGEARVGTWKASRVGNIPQKVGFRTFALSDDVYVDFETLPQY
jgi:hypothetical protein